MNRALFFFWRFGNQTIDFVNDKAKPVSYNWGFSDQYNKVFGIINDNRVRKVEITLNNGDILTQTDFYDDLFLFVWKSDDSKQYDLKNIRGYDSGNNMIFTEKH